METSGAALERDQLSTPAADGPDAVLPRLILAGTEAIARWPGVVSVGIGVPGLYDPAIGDDALPGQLPGRLGRAWPSRARSGPPWGCPRS